MAKADFVNELVSLGFKVQEPDATKVSFEYDVPVGRNVRKKLLLGFDVPADFPANCPTGPHFHSVGFPGWVEPPNNVNGSPFGGEWRYWSRPFPDWNRSDKKVKTYMAHIRNLLAKL